MTRTGKAACILLLVGLVPASGCRQEPKTWNNDSLAAVLGKLPPQVIVLRYEEDQLKTEPNGTEPSSGGRRWLALSDAPLPHPASVPRQQIPAKVVLDAAAAMGAHGDELAAEFDREAVFLEWSHQDGLIRMRSLETERDVLTYVELLPAL